MLAIVEKQKEQEVELIEPPKMTSTRADQLSPQKHKCIDMMIEGHQQREIAVEIGVTPETISRWKRQTTFAREYNKRAKEVNAGGIAILRSNYVDACQKLAEIAFEPNGDRLQMEACKTIIKLVKEEELIEEFNTRLERIEQMANREA